MASLGAIRDAIKATLDANIAGLRVYDTVPDNIDPPALLILPLDADFDVAFGRGSDTYQIDLFVMTSRVVPRTSQDALDAFVTGAGASSRSGPDLREQDSRPHRRHRGARLGDVPLRRLVPRRGIDHIGAALRLVVTTPGTA
jgi:hypothetical protein